METETEIKLPDNGTQSDYRKIQKGFRNLDRQAYGLKDGNTWNPLLKYPRNRECYCGSRIKHKKCCVNNKSPFVSKAQAEEFTAYMKDTGAR